MILIDLKQGKFCTRCEMFKKFECFYENGLGSLASECKSCCNARSSVYAKENREKIRMRARVSWQKNKEQRLAYQKEWNRKNPEKRKAITKRWKDKYLSNPEIRAKEMTMWSLKGKVSALKLKKAIMDAYGGKCSCCGETSLAFLTIEHSFHDGNIVRQRVGNAGAATYRDLRDRGYPQDEGITVHCWNCQMATKHGAVCPHKEKSCAYSV